MLLSCLCHGLYSVNAQILHPMRLKALVDICMRLKGNYLSRAFFGNCEHAERYGAHILRAIIRVLLFFINLNHYFR